MEHAHASDMAIADTELTGVNASIEVSSGAFGYNEPIPAQYTADGEGLSPPLEWRGGDFSSARLPPTPLAHVPNQPRTPRRSVMIAVGIAVARLG